jgi:hypothetical protein
LGWERSALKLTKRCNKNKNNTRLYLCGLFCFFPSKNALSSIKYNYSMKQANRNYGAIGKRTPTDCVINAE